MSYKPYFERFGDGEKPLGVGRKPTEEQLRERLRKIETFMKAARRDGNLTTLAAARDELRVVLGMREGRTLDSGTLHYDRTDSEAVMDIEYVVDGNRLIDKEPR